MAWFIGTIRRAEAVRSLCSLLLYYTKGHWLEFVYGYLEISPMLREAHLCSKIDFAVKLTTFH